MASKIAFFLSIYFSAMTNDGFIQIISSVKGCCSRKWMYVAYPDKLGHWLCKQMSPVIF